MGKTRNEQVLPAQENQILIDLVDALCGRDKEILKKEFGIDKFRLSHILNNTEKFRYGDLEAIFLSLKKKENDIFEYVDDLSKINEKDSEKNIKKIKTGWDYLTSNNFAINELSCIDKLRKKGFGYITDFNSEPLKSFTKTTEYHCLFPKTSKNDAKAKEYNCNYNTGILTIDRDTNEVIFKLEIPYEEEKKKIKRYDGIIYADDHDNIHIRLHRNDEENVADVSSIQLHIFDKNKTTFFIGLVLTTSFGELGHNFPTIHRIALSTEPFLDNKANEEAKGKMVQKINKVLPLLGELYDRIDEELQLKIYHAYKL